MNAYTIKLAAQTPSLNEILRWKANGQHWRYANLRDAWAMEVRARLNEQGLFFSTAPGYRIGLLVERHCAGILDDDNLRGGCKPLIDALKIERVIRDDSPNWLLAHYTQQKAPRGAGFTVLTVSRGEPLLQSEQLTLGISVGRKKTAVPDAEF